MKKGVIIKTVTEILAEIDRALEDSIAYENLTIESGAEYIACYGGRKMLEEIRQFILAPSDINSAENIIKRSKAIGDPTCTHSWLELCEICGEVR